MRSVSLEMTERRRNLNSTNRIKMRVIEGGGQTGKRQRHNVLLDVEEQIAGQIRCRGKRKENFFFFPCSPFEKGKSFLPT